MRLSRRQFLQLSGALLASAAIPACPVPAPAPAATILKPGAVLDIVFTTKHVSFYQSPRLTSLEIGKQIVQGLRDGLLGDPDHGDETDQR